MLQQDGGSELDVLGHALEELTWSGCTGVIAGFCEVPVAGLPCPSSGYGSLFVLLEGAPEPPSVSYGKLELSAGQLSFNNERVAGFAELVKCCLHAGTVPSYK